LPPVDDTVEAFENRGPKPVEIEDSRGTTQISGNFAGAALKFLEVEPGRASEPDPMISQPRVTSDEIPVRVTLWRGGVKETQILRVLHLTTQPPGRAE